MAQPNYSKREIDMQISALREHIESSHKVIDEKLDKILTQTMKTNGRVGKLETWRSFLIGAWAVISIAVLPAFVFIFQEQRNNLEKQLDEHHEQLNNLRT